MKCKIVIEWDGTRSEKGEEVWKCVVWGRGKKPYCMEVKGESLDVVIRKGEAAWVIIKGQEGGV